MIYYVNHHVCKDLEDAEETQWLYRCAGIAVDILTEEEYFSVVALKINNLLSRG